MVQTIKSVAKI